jgi:hypothetical protein
VADETLTHSWDAVRFRNPLGWFGCLARQPAFQGTIASQPSCMGEIPPNSVKSTRVWVFNLTGRMVEVKVEASCGCAVPTLQKSALLPVDGMPIEVSVDTSGRSSGNYQQVVRLICRAADATWVEQILIRYTVQ